MSPNGDHHPETMMCDQEICDHRSSDRNPRESGDQRADRRHKAYLSPSRLQQAPDPPMETISGGVAAQAIPIFSHNLSSPTARRIPSRAQT
jgi:hypothetical protein